ncbi:unnamed protein product, partial [Rotaria sp. Silwood2]
LSREYITHFEDLSNELTYEIFEFLDYFHVYEAFFNLNQRFHSLLTNSTLPIRINISSISKSTLQRYYADIITSNKHRINLLNLSNLFMYDDRVFPLFHPMSKFHRLETLMLNNIESDCLKNILNQLTSLSFLSSLTISIIDEIRDANPIYYQVFHLPALKYCKLSLKKCFTNEPLLIATVKYSPIEYLILDNNIYVHQLNSFLSYVPHLRRLSFHSLCHSCTDQRKIWKNHLIHLTHLSLEMVSIEFDQFEQLVINLLPSVEVLRISGDAKYIDANRWKQLILSHLPKLRIFDILLEFYIGNDDN